MQFVNIHTHRPTGRHIEPSFAGIHPWDAGAADENALRDFRKAVVTADFAGEMGLDYHISTPREVQELWFRRQLQTASELQKPVLLHCVRAFGPTMTILADYTLQAVVFHGFIGSPQEAAQALRRGYYLSFGPRTFGSPKSLQALKATPLSQLFLETDTLDTDIEDLYRLVAEARETTVGELQAGIVENYERIFAKQ